MENPFVHAGGIALACIDIHVQALISRDRNCASRDLENSTRV